MKLNVKFSCKIKKHNFKNLNKKYLALSIERHQNVLALNKLHQNVVALKRLCTKLAAPKN